MTILDKILNWADRNPLLASVVVVLVLAILFA